MFSNRKFKQFIKNAIPISLAVLLSPIMFLAVKYKLPDNDVILQNLADNSVNLAIGKEKNSDTIVTTSVSDYDFATEDEMDELENSFLHLSYDDSFMLSYGELIFPFPSSENEEKHVENDEEIEAVPYPKEFNDNGGVIKSVTYNSFQNDEHFNISETAQVKNLTEISNEELLKFSKQPHSIIIEKNSDLPQVLIMHTHETESFEPEIRDFYDDSFSCRTTDDDYNISAVGNVIAEELENAGIKVIHNVTKHDYPSYNGSYERSRETVEQILEENPSIKIVLDVHRDALEKQDGTRLAPRTYIGENSAAQVMLISCCDDGTMDMPNYIENFKFASKLQIQLESDYPTITRPLLFDYRKYNQDLTTGSILVEVGGHANAISEALYSGSLVGKSLAKMLLETEN